MADVALRRLLILAVATLAASSAPTLAAASDTFRFVNETGETFTPNNQDDLQEGCWYNAAGVFAEGPVGAEDGSIESEAGLSCESTSWGSNVAYGQTYGGSWEQSGRPVYAWAGGTGAFGFVANDPILGWSSVSCAANGAAWEEGNGLVPIERYMTSEADGDTCTVDWLPGVGTGGSARLSTAGSPGVGHARLIDSLAAVHRGSALVRVQVFGLGNARRPCTVALRTRRGKPLGRATTRLRVGARARAVAIPLPRPARRALAKRRELHVRAIVRIADPDGSGDTTGRLTIRRSGWRPQPAALTGRSRQDRAAAAGGAGHERG